MKSVKLAAGVMMPAVFLASLDRHHPGQPPDSPHNEQRQYEQESESTRPFNTLMTATVTALPAFDWRLFSELKGPQFRVYFPTEKKQGR